MQIASLYSEAGEAVVSRHQYKLVECTDANNNTPLSEASAGGDPDTIKYTCMSSCIKVLLFIIL